MLGPDLTGRHGRSLTCNSQTMLAMMPCSRVTALHAGLIAEATGSD